MCVFVCVGGVCEWEGGVCYISITGISTNFSGHVIITPTW